MRGFGYTLTDAVLAQQRLEDKRLWWTPASWPRWKWDAEFPRGQPRTTSPVVSRNGTRL